MNKELLTNRMCPRQINLLENMPIQQETSVLKLTWMKIFHSTDKIAIFQHEAKMLC